MSEHKTLSLGGNVLPLDIEAFETLPVPVGSSIRFDFVFRFVRFRMICEHGEDSATLRLTGDVGPLPFTAESPAARGGLIQIMHHVNERFGPRLELVSGNRLRFAAVEPLPLPITATHLVSAVTAMLLPIGPYLDVIATYVRPPLAPANQGESSIRPQWRRKVGAR